VLLNQRPLSSVFLHQVLLLRHIDSNLSGVGLHCEIACGMAVALKDFSVDLMCTFGASELVCKKEQTLALE
jgi:hypothetical protein